MMDGAGSFPKRWTIANTLALLLGYALYTPIAHGLAGGHPRGLNAFQVLTHSVALTAVGVSVAAAQRQVLRPTSTSIRNTLWSSDLLVLCKRAPAFQVVAAVEFSQ